ncbi:MAG: FAD-binding oxidoreductase [Candidatus Nitrosocaldus sp.]
MDVDVIVVGAGIAGLSVAEVMLNRGMKVCVVEAKHAGYGATGRSAGIATVQMNDLLDVRLAKEGIDILNGWCRRYNLDGILSTTGLLSIDRQESIMNYARLFSESGVAYEVMDAREAMDRWPWLRLNTTVDAEECIYTKDDICMDPLVFARAFADRLKDMGVEFVSGRADIPSIRMDEEHIVLRSGYDHDDLVADNLVLCTGAWTKGIGLKGYAYTTILKVPLIFFRYNIEEEEGHIIPFADEINHTYWIPSRAGMLVGADYSSWSIDGADDALGEEFRIEQVSDDADGDDDDELLMYIKQLRKLLVKRISFDVYESKVHFGPINITPDGRPIVGRVPGFKNLYILDGLRGYGLARAPALAYILAEHIIDGTDIAGELEPTRFARDARPLRHSK